MALSALLTIATVGIGLWTVRAATAADASSAGGGGMVYIASGSLTCAVEFPEIALPHECLPPREAAQAEARIPVPPIRPTPEIRQFTRLRLTVINLRLLNIPYGIEYLYGRFPSHRGLLNVYGRRPKYVLADEEVGHDPNPSGLQPITLGGPSGSKTIWEYEADFRCHDLTVAVSSNEPPKITARIGRAVVASELCGPSAVTVRPWATDTSLCSPILAGLPAAGTVSHCMSPQRAFIAEQRMPVTVVRPSAAVWHSVRLRLTQVGLQTAPGRATADYLYGRIPRNRYGFPDLGARSRRYVLVTESVGSVLSAPVGLARSSSPGPFTSGRQFWQFIGYLRCHVLTLTIDSNEPGPVVRALGKAIIAAQVCGQRGSGRG